MSERERDEPSGTETTGHEWDGIKELDTPLPRWWLWIWYGSILWAFVYWILMPAWPGISGYTKGVLGQSDRAGVVRDLGELARQRQAGEARLRDATLQQIEADPDLQAYAMQVGQSVFGDNCATCHGAGGAGAKGYPNLRDDVWLWGGSLDEIRHTIQVGVRSGHAQARGDTTMPAFGRDQMLNEAQVSDMTEFVVALSGRKADAGAVGRAPGLGPSAAGLRRPVLGLPWAYRDGRPDPRHPEPDRRRMAVRFGPDSDPRPDLARPQRRHADLGGSVLGRDAQGAGRLRARQCRRRGRARRPDAARAQQ